MSLLFLFPLGITIGAVVLPRFVRDESGEIATFGTAIAILCFVLTLILSPWGVKLLLLLLILNRARLILVIESLFRWGQPRPATQIPQIAIPFISETDADPASALPSVVETSLVDAALTEPSSVICQYRGACWVFNPDAKVPEQRPEVELRYRGAIVRGEQPQGSF